MNLNKIKRIIKNNQCVWGEVRYYKGRGGRSFSIRNHIDYVKYALSSKLCFAFKEESNGKYHLCVFDIVDNKICMKPITYAPLSFIQKKKLPVFEDPNYLENMFEKKGMIDFFNQNFSHL